MIEPLKRIMMRQKKQDISLSKRKIENLFMIHRLKCLEKVRRWLNLVRNMIQQYTAIRDSNKGMGKSSRLPYL